MSEPGAPTFLRANAALLTLILAGSAVAIIGFAGSLTGAPAGATGVVPTLNLDPVPTGSPDEVPMETSSAPVTSAPVTSAPVTTTPAAVPTDLALRRPVVVRDTTGQQSVTTLTDGNRDSAWQGRNGFPQTVTVDLGSGKSVRGIRLALPGSAAGWPARTQTLSVQRSLDGTTFQPLVAPAGYSFSPAKANTVAIDTSAATTRFLRLTITANSAAGGAQLSDFAVYASPPPGGATGSVAVNLALHCPATATGEIRAANGPSYATDGDAVTYWEGPHHGLPDSITVDLLAPTPVSRIVVKLPPLSTWPARTQTLSVRVSTNGSTFTVLKGSATYSFSPQNGNQATIAVTARDVRYLRLDFTDNSVWDASQASEVQVYR